MIEVTDANFEAEVLKGHGPVLVDFWAPWCGPCRMLGPILEEVSKEHSSKVKIVKVNVDESPGTSQKFSISSIPTMILFKDGQKVDQKVGVLSKDAILKWIESAK